MKTLFEICRAKKVWRELPDGNHNETVEQDGYFDFIYDFMQKIRSGNTLDLS